MINRNRFIVGLIVVFLFASSISYLYHVGHSGYLRTSYDGPLLLDEANVFQAFLRNDQVEISRFQGSIADVFSIYGQSDEVFVFAPDLVDVESSGIRKVNASGEKIDLSREEIIGVLTDCVDGKMVLKGRANTIVDGETSIEYETIDLFGDFEGQLVMYANHGKTKCLVPNDLTNIDRFYRKLKWSDFDGVLLVDSILPAAIACLVYSAAVALINYFVRKNQRSQNDP